MNIFTFGYEGLSIDDFIARLTAREVRQVLDVREMPLSRKRGFSKKAFALALESAGIGYIHLRVLGCPRPIRNRYKVDEDWTAYVENFQIYLGEQHAAINELTKLAKRKTTCLVCFEADFNRCHRSLVARASYKIGGPEVYHLTAREVIADADAIERRAAQAGR